MINKIIDPCLIKISSNEDQEILKKEFQIDETWENIYKETINDPEQLSLINNYNSYAKKIAIAKDLVGDVQMKYCLVPIFGLDNSAGFIGGYPDLSSHYSFDFNDPKKSYEKLWPRCGCCHKRMKFIGSFNLISVDTPIHILTSYKYDISDNAYSYISSLGNFRLHQHNSIYSHKYHNVFACLSSRHSYHNPNFNVFVLVNTIYKNEKNKCNSIPCNKDLLPKGAKLYSRVRNISRFEFKIQIENDYDIIYKNGMNYEKLVEKYPDIFSNYEEYRLFGYPKSQQEPKEYLTTNGFCPQIKMTPFINFNDNKNDITYQLYCDMQSSNGYFYYGKVDSSST